MKQDFQQALMGKKISRFDGFSGTSNSFIILKIEETDTSCICYGNQNNTLGIDVPFSIIPELVEKGMYESKEYIDGCDVSQIWLLDDAYKAQLIMYNEYGVKTQVLCDSLIDAKEIGLAMSQTRYVELHLNGVMQFCWGNFSYKNQ